MRKISARAAGVGRSTKKISSKRPLRSSSGGSAAMSLAVATRNTRARCSAIQVRKEPSTRRDMPPSPSPRRQALLDLVDPQHARRHLLGRAQRLAQVPLGLAVVLVVERAEVQAHQRHADTPATARAARLLPQPCTPSSSTPLGASRSRRAAGERRLALLEPALQARQAADVGEVRRVVLEGQHAAAVEQLVLAASSGRGRPR